MPDSDQYPLPEELDKIRNWPHTQGFCQLFAFVKPLWAYAESGAFNEFTNKGGELSYHLHTFGWSGNEELISAMKENLVFWGYCWFSSERGGHYVFKFKEIN